VVDEVRVQLSEEGADARRLDVLTGFLRRELLELEVQDVTTLSGGPPPPGARAADAAAIGGLLVVLGKSAEGLAAVVRAVRSWLARGGSVKRTVRLEIGGDVLELSEASVADQDRLIALFVSRHSISDGE
jgi:hypothetical protein